MKPTLEELDAVRCDRDHTMGRPATSNRRAASRSCFAATESLRGHAASIAMHDGKRYSLASWLSKQRLKSNDRTGNLNETV